jgi:hypothetical protein
MFLAGVVVIIFVSTPLLCRCSWQSFVEPLQASQSTAFDRASVSVQSIVPSSASQLAASENGGFVSPVSSEVSDNTIEDERAFHPSTVLGILGFFALLLWNQRTLFADHEELAKPYYCLNCSVLERPD